MKKILLAMLLLVSSIACFAQYEEEADSVAAEPDYTTSICGVEFGRDYRWAKMLLENKFGAASDYTTNSQLVFDNKTYAGVFFNRLIFGFQSDGKRTYFNKCILCIDANNAEDAKRKRDYLYEVLSGKYFMTSKIGDDKFKFYQGGTDPLDIDSYGFMVDVLHFDDYWGARLFYGPYNYVQEEF